MVLMGLGPHRFGISMAAYQSLARSTAVRWPANKPIGGAPIHQFLGPDEDTVTMSGIIYPEWTPGYSGLSALRASARTGVAQMLVSALGDVFGRWVVTRVDEHDGFFNMAGVPRKVEFDIEIKSAAAGSGLLRLF